ncbi:galactose-binding domain-containing protein, partial [Blyttiomyces helicus]
DNSQRVSSVLNRDAKAYGKKFLTDGSEETCWNSDQGSPQWISIELAKPATVTRIELMFQGGFAGKDCEVLGVSSSGNDGVWQSLGKFYPEDVNRLQISFLSRVKVVFGASTDFFGRIVVYLFDVIGEEVEGV